MRIFGKPNSKRKNLSILLAAASGLQISSEIKAEETDGNKCTDENILNALKRCRGFHVGSYQNRLFKRCLYSSKIPAIVFMHDGKIACTIKIGKCHFLFNDEKLWEKFIKTYPLSLWVACGRNTYKNILEKLKQNMQIGDWAFSTYAEATLYPIVIGHNSRFRDACKKIGVSPYG